MSAGRVLVVDDQPAFRRLLVRILADAGYDVTQATDGRKALALLREQPFHLVVSDVNMPAMDGMKLLERVRAEIPNTQVVLITAHGSVSAAVDAMQHGAFSYLTKPLSDPDELLVVARKALANRRAAEADAGPLGAGDGEMVYAHASMQRVSEMIRLVAPVDATVLLLGESGTGKDVVARAIHGLSPRLAGPFVAVNCAALAENLLDSELFGHERGAFTGAEQKRAGKFEAAHGGTLFLDEIGETSPALQAKLLRVLQEKAFQRVGGNKTIDVDVRVVAATNRDLHAEVAEGRFRQDLYYRLNVFPIQIPPLKDRGDDVLLLARHFLGTLSERHGRGPLELTAAAQERLRRHTWPGNVRELYNTMERAVILARHGVVDETAFMGLPQGAAAGTTAPAPSAQGDIRRSQPINLKTLEQDAIRRALKKTDGNRRRAAELLGIGLRTLQYKIKEYDLT